MAGVKAMGVMVDGRAQVSINITDMQRSPVANVHAAVCSIAKRVGAQTAEGEVIGLIPNDACVSPDGETLPEWLRQTESFQPDEKILERRLLTPLNWPEPMANRHV